MLSILRAGSNTTWEQLLYVVPKSMPMMNLGSGAAVLAVDGVVDEEVVEAVDISNAQKRRQ